VLPGVDDGPPDVASAVALVRAMAAAGTTTVVATSHVSDEFPNRPDGLAAARAELEAALAAEGVAVEVLPGAEVALEQAALLDDATLRALTLGGGPYLLVEAPLSPSVVEVEAQVLRLIDRGHRAVLAHPERSPAFQRDHGQLVRLVTAGALVSITAAAVEGRFGRTAHAAAVRMLTEDLVHDVASDAHDLVGRSPAPVPAALGAVGRWLTEDAPAAILRGEAPGLAPAAYEPPAAPRRRRWSLRRR